MGTALMRFLHFHCLLSTIMEGLDTPMSTLKLPKLFVLILLHRIEFLLYLEVIVQKFSLLDQRLFNFFFVDFNRFLSKRAPVLWSHRFMFACLNLS